MKKIFITIIIVAILFIPGFIILNSILSFDSYNKKDFISKEELTDVFTDNYSSFEKIKNCMKNDRHIYFIYMQNNHQIRIRDENDYDVDIDKDKKKDFTYLLKSLKFDSIQYLQYYDDFIIDFLYEDDGVFEQHILYIENFEEVRKDYKDLFKIKDNWYYYEANHNHY